MVGRLSMMFRQMVDYPVVSRLVMAQREMPAGPCCLGRGCLRGREHERKRGENQISELHWFLRASAHEQPASIDTHRQPGEIIA
jgi:hypothetical protein